MKRKIQSYFFSLAKTREEARLEHDRQRIISSLERQLERERNQLVLLTTRLSPLTTQLLAAQRHRLDLLQQRSASLDPQLILNRGYSITTLDGKAVRSASQLKTGNEIETRLSKGIIKSIVT